MLMSRAANPVGTGHLQSKLHFAKHKTMLICHGKLLLQTTIWPRNTIKLESSSSWFQNFLSIIPEFRPVKLFGRILLQLPWTNRWTNGRRNRMKNSIALILQDIKMAYVYVMRRVHWCAGIKIALWFVTRNLEIYFKRSEGEWKNSHNMFPKIYCILRGWTGNWAGYENENKG